MKVCTTKERLKEIIEKRNLKQVEILRLCQPYCEKYSIKLTKSELSLYVSGKAQPRQDKLSILSMALNVSETWLMGYDLESSPKFNFKAQLLSEIEREYGNNSREILELYIQLDNEDKAEIRGEIKGLLKAEKYFEKDILFEKKMA